MTSLRVAEPRYASGVDAGVHGAYVARLYAPRFTRPIEIRHGLHLYASWSCPGSHRATIVRELLGLQSLVSVSYVDVLRDARGWAFREPTGADHVNGFTLLREAYEWTEPGYDGPATLPVLWDRRGSHIVSNDPDGIDAGLAGSLYPHAHREEIDELSRWIERTIQLGPAAYDDRARAELLGGFGTLSARLANRRYLLGDELTLADVRLWVSLVRYDAGPNAHGAVGPKLPAWEHLWSYARGLYQLPAFRSTTRLRAIAAPFATLPDWGG